MAFGDTSWVTARQDCVERQVSDTNRSLLWHSSQVEQEVAQACQQQAAHQQRQRHTQHDVVSQPASAVHGSRLASAQHCL